MSSLLFIASMRPILQICSACAKKRYKHAISSHQWPVMYTHGFYCMECIFHAVCKEGVSMKKHLWYWRFETAHHYFVSTPRQLVFITILVLFELNFSPHKFGFLFFFSPIFGLLFLHRHHQCQCSTIRGKWKSCLLTVLQGVLFVILDASLCLRLSTLS